MYQASLAATISFDRATVGGVIDRGEHKGLLERAESSGAPAEARAINC